MNIDWDVVRKNIKFLVALFRPSLAKALSVPLLLAGIHILNPPLWLDILNWLLSNQKVLPEYSEPISTPMYITGWVLIGLSILVYLIDVFLQVKSMRQRSEKRLLDTVRDHPKQTADLIVDKIRSAGFTAQHLQDEKIETLANEVTLLRFFGSFSKKEKSTTLAESIIEGELSGGTPHVKARVLALLARYMSGKETVEQAKKWLSTSKKLCETEEYGIAHAFIEAIGSNNVDKASHVLKLNNPSGYAAFFVIKKIVEGSSAALGWLEDAGLNIKDLDTDGRIVLVSTLLSEHKWEKALNIVREMDDESLLESPVLAQLSAFAFLTNAIKVASLREVVMNSIPLAAERFPLADDAASVAYRNRAVKLFGACSSQARRLGAGDVADIFENYVLWLELRDIRTHEKAKAQLCSYFVNYTQKTLEYLALAFSFGIDIDFESIEKEVNRQSALSSSDNPTLGLARFVLAQTKKSFSAVVEYIASYRSQIEKAVSPIALDMFEVEALAGAGLIDDAEQLLQKIKVSGVPDAEVANLQNIIDVAKGEDPVALAIRQYQESNTTNDLAHLVGLLEKRDYKEKYYLYCRELFEHTGQEFDAIKICNAASSLGKFSELHQFLAGIMDLVERSEGLKVHWAWSLFRKGELNRAQEMVVMLRQSKLQSSDLKVLEINLSIFSGDWESLSTIVEDSWHSREQLKANDLLQTVQLAKAVSPQRAKQLLEFCTTQYRDDPQILASSYFTAATMGWEGSQETSEWLNKAIILSNDDGPLHRASLEDLKEMMTEAREKNEKVYKAYQDGDAPIFTVAELLNRTLSDFYFIQPFENQKTKDVRRKNLVPIFHVAKPVQIIGGEVIAIDVSSALVIENVGLLAHLFDCFERIVIPHSFMRWLFEEKQKVAFHQPSQIEKAKYFERLISDGRASVFHPKKINNPELALDVGDELAFMLEEANENPKNEQQALVVCSSPVYKNRGSSFREVEADLSLFYSCLISCSKLAEKLKDMAFITEAQCLKAISYLAQHEKDWPANIEISSGAKLYIDSLSITYLMTVDLFDKLSEAGFEVYVFNEERNKYKSLVNYDSTIKQAESKIENIRKLFSKGLADGKVTLSEMSLNRGKVATSKSDCTKPTQEIFEAAKVCDAVLIDDRFINRHSTITLSERSIPIFTSLDFVETLQRRGLISIAQKLDARASLRELGYEFVSISTEELEYHINHSSIVDGEFNPNKQLRLIRDNLLLIRISGLIQLPRDAQWLHESMRTIAKAIRAQWATDISLELSRARSCWLYGLMGYREWAQAHQIRGDGGMADLGEVFKVNSILIATESISNDRQEDYKAWLDEFILEPLKELDILSFKNLSDSVKHQVKSISGQSKFEEELDG